MTVTINGTTGIAGVNGSAATPAVQGADTNTGVFYGTDIVAISTGGTERMRVNASGNVGVGTSSPTQKVSIAGGLSFNSALSFTGSGYEIGKDGADFLCFSAGSAGTRFLDASTATEFMRLDINSNLQFNSGYGSVAVAYGCRAWVNFNGTGTVAIRGSGNVSSITDNGTGAYTMNFTTAMPDVNFSCVASAINDGVVNAIAVPNTINASSVGVSTIQTNAITTSADVNKIYVAIFR